MKKLPAPVKAQRTCYKTIQPVAIKKYLTVLFFFLLISFQSNSMIVQIQKVDDACTESIGWISAEVVSGGGMPPYVFVWSNGITDTAASTTSRINNLVAGIYSVTVHDAAGDSSVNSNIVINNASNLDRNGFFNAFNMMTNVDPVAHAYAGFACPNQSDGIMFGLLPEVGGTPPYTVSSLFINGAIGGLGYTGLGMGGYYFAVDGLRTGDIFDVTIADNAGCPGNFNDEELGPDYFSTNTITITPSTNGQNNATATFNFNMQPWSVNISMSDGLGQQFNYNAVNGSLLIGNNLHAGTYSVYMQYNNVRNNCDTTYNITITNTLTPNDYYWVGGTGNWSDYANHWATASGGSTFYAVPPDSLDDVYFDANSFLTTTDTVYTSGATLNYCRNLDWTGSFGFPTFLPISLTIYGSMTLNPGMNYFGAVTGFAGSATGNTINTNGVVLKPFLQNSYLIFENPNGEWTLNSDLNTGYNGGLYSTVRIEQGKLNTNGYAVHCYDFDIFPNPVCSLYLDTSSIYCDNSFYALVSAASFILDASQSKIYAGLVNLSAGFSSAHHDYNYVESATIYGSDCNFNHVVSGGYLYNNSNIDLQEIKKPLSAPPTWVQNLFCTAAPSTIQKMIINNNPLTWVSGNKVIVDTLILNNPGDTLSIQGNDSVVVTSQFIANSQAGSPIYIKSNNPGVASNFDFGANDVCVDYLIIKENNALGSGNHYAGANSINSGLTSGWNFSACPASVYYPFPDSSANWNFHTSQVMCVPFFGTIDMRYSITLSGDTVINSQTYHKLLTPFVLTDTTSCCCTAYINSGYQGAIRQDIPGRKVFYVPPSDSVEQLLYDFNMQVGDTVKGFLESFATPADIIQSIDSVLVGNSYRKRWNINPCYNIYFIEGIGSTYGLLQLSPGCLTDLPGFTFTCHSQNNMTLYPDTITNCPLIVGGITDVWPGDANYDLTVNNFDVLNIGLAYGDTGPVRAGATNNYVAQPANDWTNFFATVVNHKHADCNGDGVVDDNDTVAIALNYGQNHPARLSNPNIQTTPAASLYIEINPDSAVLGDTLNVDVFLGTSTIPVDSIYGIAFTINFDTAYIDTSYMTFDYTGAWMGTPGVDLLTFQKTRFTDGAVDMAMVRTDQQNISGFGFLERIGIVVVDNIGARISTPFTLSNIRAITAAEYELTVNANGDSLSIDTTAHVGLHETENLENMISVYPNPAKDRLIVRSGNLKMSVVEIYNSMGEMVVNEKTNSNLFTANINYLEKGVYLIRCITDKGILNKQVVITGKN